MPMTLKEAFNIWKNNPDNLTLANKNRDAVQRVLMKKWGNVAIQDVTVSKAEAMFSSSSELQEVKSKAASILVHLLRWGHSKGYCEDPSFDFSIANNDQPTDTIEDVAEPAKRTFGRKPEPVAQLLPDTLELVKIYPSVNEAKMQTGVCNIARAVANRGLAGGYFWCAPGDVATFEPSSRRKSGGKDDAGRERDTSAVTALLAELTDEELWKELERRGWEGELSRRQVVTLGTKNT